MPKKMSNKKNQNIISKNRINKFMQCFFTCDICQLAIKVPHISWPKKVFFLFVNIFVYGVSCAMILYKKTQETFQSSDSIINYCVQYYKNKKNTQTSTAMH